MVQSSVPINYTCFSTPIMENLQQLNLSKSSEAFINCLQFHFWLRVEFLNLMLIDGWTPTYLISDSKEIHETDCNSLTTVLVIDAHSQGLRELWRLAYQTVLGKKKSWISQNLLSWTNDHWPRVYGRHCSSPVICLLSSIALILVD